MSARLPESDSLPKGASRPSLQRFLRIVISSLAVTAMFLSSCDVRFGPGFSMHDKAYFSESPHIAMHADATYGLRWQYGTLGFYFEPTAKVIDGQLLFSLQGTSSSGLHRGEYSEVAIKDSALIQALLTGGAFWLEPDGSKVRLELRRL